MEKLAEKNSLDFTKKSGPEDYQLLAHKIPSFGAASSR